MTPSVAAPGVTHPSDATGNNTTIGAPQFEAVASLGLVSPGAAIKGVTPIFCGKKN